jgi:hypothetical protein
LASSPMVAAGASSAISKFWGWSGVSVFWEADRRASGGQGEDARGQPSVSATTQTRPEFGPALYRPRRRSHPF